MYVTVQQMTDRFGAAMLVDLTDRGTVATGTIDSAVVNAAIAGADAMIDGFLSGIYALPMATVPPLLVDIALAVTIWRLHVGVPGDKVTLDYKDARASLEQISKGVIKLSVAGVAAPGSGSTGVQIVDRQRPFTEATMKGFI